MRAIAETEPKALVVVEEEQQVKLVEAETMVNYHPRVVIIFQS